MARLQRARAVDASRNEPMSTAAIHHRSKASRKRFPEPGGGGDRPSSRISGSASARASSPASSAIPAAASRPSSTSWPGSTQPTRGRRDRRRQGDRGPEPRPRRDLPGPRAAAVAHGARATSPTRSPRAIATGRRSRGREHAQKYHRPRRPRRAPSTRSRRSSPAA